ncbi:CD63 protein, partial [Polyodon spathula]|nr:CD63 protein [Polyodon spathula]
ICGIALIVIGIMVQMSLHKTLMITNASASGAPIVIIVVGVVIFFIAFFGCCGAWKESYCMVTMFAVLLTLIFLVEIAAAIAGYIFKDKVKDVFSTALEDSMKKYNQSADFREAVDTIQADFHCCGSNNYTDWFNIRHNNSVPDSCCKTRAPGCGNNITRDIYQKVRPHMRTRTHVHSHLFNTVQYI